MEVGFVDVPGHERFVKNMLAGVGAVDVALFVVAAGEGWMPQSEEHLQILGLLDISAGLVVITKADAVAPDVVDLTHLEVAQRLATSSMRNAPVVVVRLGLGPRSRRGAHGPRHRARGRSPHRPTAPARGSGSTGSSPRGVPARW